VPQLLDGQPILKNEGLDVGHRISESASGADTYDEEPAVSGRRSGERLAVQFPAPDFKGGSAQSGEIEPCGGVIDPQSRTLGIEYRGFIIVLAQISE
jgi:hypothetical protein